MHMYELDIVGLTTHYVCSLKVLELCSKCLLQYFLFYKQVAPAVKERMTKAGTAQISYQPLESRGFVNFFRIVTHPHAKPSDFDFKSDE